MPSCRAAYMPTMPLMVTRAAKREKDNGDFLGDLFPSPALQMTSWGGT